MALSQLHLFQISPVDRVQGYAFSMLGVGYSRVQIIQYWTLGMEKACVGRFLFFIFCLRANLQITDRGHKEGIVASGTPPPSPTGICWDIFFNLKCTISKYQ